MHKHKKSIQDYVSNLGYTIDKIGIVNSELKINYEDQTGKICSMSIDMDNFIDWIIIQKRKESQERIFY